MATSDQPLGSETSPPIGLRLGTWNMSSWSPEKLAVMIEEINVDILAIQETHLAAHLLEGACKAAKALGYALHHGRAVPPAFNPLTMASRVALDSWQLQESPYLITLHAEPFGACFSPCDVSMPSAFPHGVGSPTASSCYPFMPLCPHSPSIEPALTPLSSS